MVLQIILTQPNTDANNELFNNISSALVFVSLGATVITTILIGYRIHISSRSNGQPSKRMFNHIVVLVVESSAVYSLLLLAYAIVTEDPASAMLGSSGADASFYIQTVQVVVSVR